MFLLKLALEPSQERQRTVEKDSAGWGRGGGKQSENTMSAGVIVEM